jgi:Na+-driven multidrug efflux pump
MRVPLLIGAAADFLIGVPLGVVLGVVLDWHLPGLLVGMLVSMGLKIVALGYRFVRLSGPAPAQGATRRWLDRRRRTRLKRWWV